MEQDTEADPTDRRPTQPRPRFDYGWVVVIAGSVVMLVSFGMMLSYGLFIKPLADEFGWSSATISGSYSLNSIVSGIVGLFVGVLIDRLGPRIVVTICGVVLATGYLLMSQADTIWELYLFYGFLVGFGMAGMWVPPLTTVARWFGARCSMATGIMLSGMTMGQVIMPQVVGRLVVASGWRLAVLVVGIVSFVVILAGAQFLRKERPGGGTEPAAAGVTVECEGSGAAPAGAAEQPARGLTFAEALRTRQFWMVGAAFLFMGIAAFGVLIHLAPRVISLGISEIGAANVLTVNGVVGIPGSFLLGGLLGHYIGGRKAFLTTLGLMTVAMILLIPAHQLWALYLCAVVFGLGMSGMAACESPLVAGFFGVRNHGSIYAALGLGYTTGGALGPFLFGLIFDKTGGYDPAFYMAIGFAAAAIALLVLLRPPRALAARTQYKAEVQL